MDDDDDFLPAAQFLRTQPSPVQRPTSQRSQPQNTQNTQRTQPTSTTQRNQSQRTPVQSRITQWSQSTQSSSKAPNGQMQTELSQIQEGLRFLETRVKQLTGESSDIPSSSKIDKKPKIKEELKCHICSKVLANKTNLFRHYRAIHVEMNPERFYGCTVNSTIVDLNTSGSESNSEVICKSCNNGFLFKDFDEHVKVTHPDIYGKKEAAVSVEVRSAKIDAAVDAVEKNKVKEAKVIVEKTLRTKTGRILHVFTCKKCNVHFDNKFKARRHGRVHNKGIKLKSKAGNKDNKSNLHTDDIIFVCDACNIATPSYDVAVEHSQNHIIDSNAEFVSKVCEICDLKFEPVCYERHIDMHYKDKELHRESFTYLKYKYHLLLSESWFESLNTDNRVEKIVSRSIYANTRSVRMRVMSVSGSSSVVFNLYQCCQCDNFVDPTSVTNHALIYDTCVKVKRSFACFVCKRSFNTRIARDKHVKAHDGDESFRIVIFNNERDKEFNKILNTKEIGFNSNEPNEAVPNAEKLSSDKVIYRCLCNLCFVFKETADDHIKRCPGSEVKQRCLKCNNLFNLVDLQTHCFEHHLNDAESKIIDVVPNVIELDSDDDTPNERRSNDVNDVIIIDSSDDEDNVNVESENVAVSDDLNGMAIDVLDSDEDINQQISNTADTATNTSISHVAQGTTENYAEDNEASANNYEDTHHNDLEFSDDDDFEDIIANNNTNLRIIENNDNFQNINNTNAVIRITEPGLITRTNTNPIVCIPTSVLLDPYNIGIGIINTMSEIAKRRNQMETEIETMRQDIERTPSRNENMLDIKPSLIDPTDFSAISRRPSLRQIEAAITSTNNQIDVDLITDDETDLNSANDESFNTNDGDLNDDIDTKENILEAAVLADNRVIMNTDNIKKEVDLDTTLKTKLTAESARNVGNCENVNIVRVKREPTDISDASVSSNAIVPFRVNNDLRESNAMVIERGRARNLNENPNHCSVC